MLPEWDGHATDVETLEVLAALVRLTNPEVCVEAGTYRGHGAIYMARACEENGSGVVVTADVTDYGASERLAGHENVWFYRGDYLNALSEIDGNVDFAFIDASGDGEDGARLRWIHLEATQGRISAGGLICVHDTAADDWQDGEGGKSVERIRDACQLNLTAGRGLSIYHAPCT